MVVWDRRHWDGAGAENPGAKEGSCMSKVKVCYLLMTEFLEMD